MGDIAKDLTAGTAGGVANLIVGHPFDTIKVKLQSQPTPAPGQLPKYAGAIDAVKQTVAAEGPRGLYKGMGAPLATVAAFNALLFSVRGQMEAFLRSEPGVPLTVKQQVIAGAGAGIAAAAASGVALPKGPIDVAKHVIRDAGTKGLFKGLVPGNAVMFGVYEATKQYLAGGRDTSNLGRGSQILAGGLAGAAFWLSVYPTDVVKSVIQVDDYKKPKYSGSLDAMRKIGLYKGFGPAMARSVPANAATFAGVDCPSNGDPMARESCVVLVIAMVRVALVRHSHFLGLNFIPSSCRSGRSGEEARIPGHRLHCRPPLPLLSLHKYGLLYRVQTVIQPAPHRAHQPLDALPREFCRPAVGLGSAVAVAVFVGSMGAPSSSWVGSRRKRPELPLIACTKCGQRTVLKLETKTNVNGNRGRIFYMCPTHKMGDVAKDLTAGTVGGAAQLVVGHPFDTIKVKLQSQPSPPPGQPPRYAGAVDAVRQTLATEGPRGLYKGMGAPLATVAAFNAVLFTVRGQMEAVLRSDPGAPLSVAQQVVAGAGAGFAVSFLACPTELIKCRLQAQSVLATATPAPAAAGVGAGGAAAASATVVAAAPAAAVKYGGPIDVAKHVIRSEGGTLGLFKGLFPTLAREVPGNSIMFGVYEATKQLIAGGHDTSQLGRGSLIMAGGLAGASFWGLVYPTDVVKSVLQVDDHKSPKYKGSMDAVRKILAADGVKGLYKGFGPAMARSVPANAACFLAYEVISESARRLS
ncbi:hypothetical protein HU200_018770 [Digitaria exilis]|uniref:Mitochondrial carnitine/acylcarnitine carrier-like protein n=1 Tax=Digitaria exilis TaxID=1010633 RepID=A0A835F4F1_9POAL|nr:hypothetical protein HU200_018770 [Digitaria exilis]